ncbi:unnamed protein product [Paramecium octaurelia]|uniref:Uncharacterized protein n=1 Tax=Paramecium octaurelia TaxID=43137 RepID=A0A8S1XE22_PAROT|nr:unnamed protein product [Paramecium octaurelia]
MQSFRNATIQQERPRGGSVNAKSFLKNAQNNNKGEQQSFLLQANNSKKTFESQMPSKNQSSQHDLHLSYLNNLQSTEKLIKNQKFSTLTQKFSTQNLKYLSPSNGNTSKIDMPSDNKQLLIQTARVNSLLQEISDIKLQNEKVKQFYQSQIHNLQNTQDQLKIENISLSNAIKGLTQQLSDARQIMQRIYKQTDLQELNNSFDYIDFNNNSNIQKAFYQFQSEIFQFIFEYQNQTNQKIQQKQQQLNKINIKLNQIIQKQKGYDHKCIINELQVTNNNLLNQLKSQEVQLKLFLQKSPDQITYQLEEQINEFKKHHQTIINNLEQEKEIAVEQEAQLKKEFQKRIQKLEQELSVLLDENQRKEQLISELNDLNQSKVLQMQKQEEISQLTNKLQEGLKIQVNLNDQIVVLKQNCNSLLNDFEKQQFEISKLQKEKQYFQTQFEDQLNQNMELMKQQQLQNENHQIQLTSLNNEWQQQNYALSEKLKINETKFNKLQENHNILDKQKQELENFLKQYQNESNKFKDQVDQIQQFQLKINKQNQTIQNLIQQNQSYENMINKNASEKKVLEQQIVELKQNNQCISSNKQQVQPKDNKNEDEQSEIKTRQIENCELQRQIKQEHVNQQQLKTQISSLQNDITLYQLQKTQLEQQLDLQQKNNSELLTQMEELTQNNLDQQEQQADEWKNQYNMLSKKQNQSDQNLNQALQINEKLRVRVLELEQKFEEEMDRNQQLVEESKKYSIDSKQKDVEICQFKLQIQMLTQQLHNLEKEKAELKVNQSNDRQNGYVQVIKEYQNQTSHLEYENQELQEQLKLQSNAYNQELEQCQLKIQQNENEAKENLNNQKHLSDRLQETLKNLEQIQQQLLDEQLKSQQLMKQLSSISENKSSSQPNQDFMDLFDVQQSPRGQQIGTVQLPETNYSEEQISILSQQLHLLQQQIKQLNESLEEKDILINEINQQKFLIENSWNRSQEKITKLESEIFEQKQVLQRLDQSSKDINHYQQKISNQQKIIQSLQNQIEKLQIEFQEQENNLKILRTIKEQSEEQVANKELIEQKDEEILKLQEELKNIYQKVELRMNKSVISNGSKRSQNIVKFEQFADLDENDVSVESNDEEQILEKLNLQKIVKENCDKMILTQQELKQKEQEILDLKEEVNRLKGQQINQSLNSQGADHKNKENNNDMIQKQQYEILDLQKEVEIQNQMIQQLLDEKRLLEEIIQTQQNNNQSIKEQSQFDQINDWFN